MIGVGADRSIDLENPIQHRSSSQAMKDVTVLYKVSDYQDRLLYPYEVGKQNLIRNGDVLFKTA